MRDAPQVFWMQARFASGATSLLQRPQPAAVKLPLPATDRLPMHPDQAGDCGRMHSLTQQPSPHNRRSSNSENLATLPLGSP